MRVTVLRPFIATQARLVAAWDNRVQVAVLRQQLDSLAASLSTQAALRDENRTLRNLLDLAERVEPSFKATSVLRGGTPGSESMFIVQLGSRDGITMGAPVVSRHGLVGRILEVREEISLGMDWTHPDFRASAMLENGTMYGIVENRRGTFREEDRLVLNGTAYYESAPRGTLVVTSGLAGVLPRGIPIGRIGGVEDVEGRWRKAYRLEPMVEPGSVTHVIVLTDRADLDLAQIWGADSLATREQAISEGRMP
jgi:rod shape-determining protein MreC